MNTDTKTNFNYNGNATDNGVSTIWIDKGSDDNWGSADELFVVGLTPSGADKVDNDIKSSYLDATDFVVSINVMDALRELEEVKAQRDEFAMQLAIIEDAKNAHEIQVNNSAAQLLTRFEDGDYDCSDVWETITNRYYDATGAFRDDLYSVVMDELDKRNVA